MRLRFSSRFESSYKTLTSPDKKAVQEALDLFQDDPLAPALSCHDLRGPLAGLRALSAGPDLRLTFRVKGEYAEALFVEVGTHAQVYKKKK